MTPHPGVLSSSGPATGTSDHRRTWGCLTPPEVRLLGRLSVFAGGWSLDAAQQVCAGDGLDVEHVSTLHDALVTRCLSAAGRGDPQRYHLVGDTDRSAARRLTEAGEFDAVSLRHAQWCLAFVEGEAAEAVFPAGEAWLSRLDPELDNIRAGLRWARDGDPQLGVRLVSALMRYWQFRGHLKEAGDWLNWAMAVTADDAPSSLRASVVRQAALVQCRLGDWHTARTLVEQATGLYEAIGDPEGAAVTRHHISVCRSPRDAVPALDASIGLARAADVTALVHLLRSRGQAQFLSGKLGAARSDFDECVALGRRESYRDALLLGLLGLARVDLTVGDCPAVARELDDALALASLADDRPNAAIALALTAELSRLRGDYGRSRDLLAAAFERDWAEGEAMAIARDLLFLARLELATGMAETAKSRFEEALGLVRSANGAAYHETRCLLGLAAATMAAGEADRARVLSELVGEIAATNDDRQAAAESLQLLARLGRATGRDDGSAIRQCQRALRLYEVVGDLPGVTACLDDAAALFADHGWYESAARLLGAAHGLRDTHGYARPPVDHEAHEQVVLAVAGALGDRWEVARVQGRTLSSVEAVAIACNGQSPQARTSKGRGGLTPTEREVARLVAKGLTSVEAATRLAVSHRTVETHVAHIYAKLGIHSRTALRGWTDDAAWVASEQLGS